MSQARPAGVNELVYRVEQRFVALALSVMGVVVFLDVVHRVASRELSVAWSAFWAVVAVLMVVGALRLRGREANAATAGLSVALVVLGYAALRVFLGVVPNGLVWSQTLGLALMLWVGIFGASMATREHRHLALDLGSKLWPKRLLPAVQGVGNVVTALFCATLGLLSLVSLRDHYRDWADSDGAAGVFAALAIPKWVAFGGLPVGFLLMTVRFLGQAVESFRGRVEEDDALHMLGLDEPAAPAKPAPSAEPAARASRSNAAVVVGIVAALVVLMVVLQRQGAPGLVVSLCIAVLLLLGARLFVVVGLATMLSFMLILGEGLDPDKLVRIVNKMEGLTTKNVFLSIPMFIAAGTVMTRGGMAARLVRIATSVVGFLPGGLAIASIAACMVFAAISGSSPVTLVAVGTVMFPALVAGKFPRDSAMGLLMTAGSLGCLLPPSVAMLIYAISVSGSSGVDPSDLFLAGSLPALGISGLLAVYAGFVGHRSGAPRQPFEAKELIAALKEGGFALALPFIVVGGIYSGQFTPTEAGAVALMYSVVVCTFVHREMKGPQLAGAFAESAVLVGSLILIVVLAFGLNDFLAEIEAAERMGQWLRGAGLSPFMFLLVVNVALIVIGALMDSVSATLVFAPLLAPIAIDVYGMDPIHFGVVFVVNMEIGYLMPPVATNLFVGAAIFKEPFGRVARAVLPTLAMVCVALVALMYVPTLSVGALNLKRGQPFVQAFPWGGRAEAAPMAASSDAGTAPTGAGGKRPMTMEEMMRAANQALKAAETADAGAEAP